MSSPHDDHVVESDENSDDDYIDNSDDDVVEQDDQSNVENTINASFDIDNINDQSLLTKQSTEDLVNNDMVEIPVVTLNIDGTADITTVMESRFEKTIKTNPST